MPAPLRLPLVGLLVFLSGLAGFWLGRIGPDNSSSAAESSKQGFASAAGLSSGSGERMAGGAGTSGSAQYAENTRLPWNRERIADAGLAILRQSNVFSSIRPMMRLADSLDLEDMPAAMEAIEDLKEMDGKEIFAIFVMMRWAELDPADAAAKAKAADGKSFFDPAQQVTIPIWAERDPFAALAWAKSLTDEDRKKKSLELVIETVARRSVEEALQMARAHAPELIPTEGMPKAIVEALNQKPAKEAARYYAAANDIDELAGAVRRWAAKDRPGALAWARGLQEPEQQRAAFNAVISEWSQADARAAASVLDAMVSDGGKLGQAAGAIARNWPANDLQALQARVTQWPDGPAQNEMAEQLAERLGQADPDGGARWIHSLPEGAARDHATEGYAKSVARKDGGTAVEWALSIADEGKRNAVLEEVSREWFRNDPAAAFEWMRDTTLLNEEQKRAALGRRAGK